MTVWWKCLGASVPTFLLRSTLPFCSELFAKCGLIVGHIYLLGTRKKMNSHGRFPKLGVSFFQRGTRNRDYSILVSTLGSPFCTETVTFPS